MFRLLGFLLAGALISALVFGACLSACGVAMVSVVADGGPNLVAPVPLILPLAALHFVPEHLPERLMDRAMHDEMDEFRGPALLGLAGFLEALEDADDAVLVQVSEPDNEVRIAKEGENLVIRVREGGGEGPRVFVSTPLRALAEAARSACEPHGASFRCHPAQLARSFIPVVRGSEIEVRDGDTRVDVSGW